MTPDPTEHRKPLPIWVMVILWILLLWGAYVIDQTLRWTDRAQGFANGLFHLPFYVIAGLCFATPWLLAIWGLYRWRGWRKYRSASMLAPAFVLALVSLGALVVDPPTPARRFKERMNLELPNSVRNLRWHFSGGGFVDITDVYYFQTSLEETVRLIEAMDLSLDRSSAALDALHLPQLPEAPDPAQWPGLARFIRHGEGELKHWTYELFTDATRTHVFIRLRCL